MYHVTKHYPHSLGLSACFAQPDASSHCRFPHGYPLAFTFEFQGEKLDHNNWLIDFGSLRPLKEWLQITFDHRQIIAERDTEMRMAMGLLVDLDRANVLVWPNVGCEAFAYEAFQFCRNLLHRQKLSPRVQLVKATCAEHEGNSASFSNQYVPGFE